MPRRITHGVQRGDQVRVIVDDREVVAYRGETIASVLLAEGIHVFYKTASGKARGPYCNMGTCFECQVKVQTPGINGWSRACMLFAEEGMRIITGVQKPAR